MSIIKVTVDDQALYVTESPVVAAQGVNENFFQFTLSADWSGFGVVALFWKEGNEDTVYESVVDGTGKALVPHEVTDLQGRFCVGLAGTKGNIIHTSEVLKYKVVKGRYTAGQGSEPPTPGIYEQMLSLAGQMSDQFRQVVEEQSEVIEDLQEDQAALRSELTAQQTTFQNTISGQMASFIASQSGDYGATVLWDMDVEGDHNGALAQDTVLTLRENIEGFDFIEIWGFNTDVDDSVFIPVEKLSGVGTAVKSVNIGLGTIKLRIVETRLMGQYNELTIAHQFIFTFDTTHTATRITQDNKSTYVSQFGISRVIGRKMVQNAELVDIRVGENGTTYQTAGAAVRGQFSAVKAQIPLIDASLATTGKAADAKATGDALATVNGRLGDLKSDLNETNDNLSLFGTTEAGLSEVAITTNNGQAVYNKEGQASNGNIISSSNAGYCVISVNAGERYFITTRAGGNYSAVAFFNSPTISKESYIGSPSYQSSYTTLADYMVTVQVGATHMTVNTLNYTEYPISIVKLNVLKSVNALYEAGYGKQSDIDKILSKYNYIEQCQKVGDALVTRNAYMNGRNVITGAIDAYSLTDYFETKSGDLFFLNFVYRITVFNSNKEYVREISVQSLSNYSGSVRWNTWTATGDGYVRFSINNTSQPYWGAAVKMLNTGDYELVSLGDSLFGNNQKPYDLTTYIQNATNMKSANCGFGGTRASATTAEQYKPLCFCNIADAINTGDWSAIDIDWATLYGDNVFMVNKDLLVNIDWDKVKIITVAFGTNDMNGNVPLDNENNPLDKTTYKGGLRYGIEKILSAYPQITIVMLAPLYRYRAVGASATPPDYSEVAYDSDTGYNGTWYMMPYVSAMEEVAQEYHLPFFDNYNGVGLNKLTAPYWLRDGTHLNYTVGPYKIGTRIGEEIASVANNNRPKD